MGLTLFVFMNQEKVSQLDSLRQQLMHSAVSLLVFYTVFIRLVLGTCVCVCFCVYVCAGVCVCVCVCLCVYVCLLHFSESKCNQSFVNVVIFSFR